MISRQPAAASGYTRLVSGILFPLHERLKHHATVKVRRALEASQWWPAERLASLQLARLQRLLTDAAEHTPYYRSLFASMALNPRDVTSLDQLQDLPLLTKAEIRANTDLMKSARAVGLRKSNTGGSSGEPLVFFLGAERVSHDVAAKWRATRWWGVDIGDREIVVWGSPIELGAQDRVRRMRDWLLRSTLLPAFEMSEKKLDAFVGRIRSTRPKMLFGYPSALSHIARHAEARNVRMDDLGIAVAFVTSERLYDDQRETLARVFGCRVANGYGGRDAGFVAHECPAGGMHITAEDIIVEIVDANGRAAPAGQSGEIVITHLATKDFPFIRYRTGDYGTLSTQSCACGRGLPLLGEIQGRSTDFVVAADGTVMHGLALIYVVRDLPGIAAFRIIQESRAMTRVELVPAPGFDPTTKDAIERGIRARLGPQVSVLVEEVASLATERSGKHRYVVSKAIG
jgi:phenylacetate-CoA ligase